MNRLQWSALDEGQRRAALLRPVQQVADATRDAVAALIAQVGTDGDAALREITLRFDKVALDSFDVSDREFAAAEALVAPELKSAMQDAAQRIEAFHRAGMAQPACRWRLCRHVQPAVWPRSRSCCRARKSCRTCRWIPFPVPWRQSPGHRPT